MTPRRQHPRIGIAVLLLVLTAPALPAQQVGTVRGVVFDSTAMAPLPGAMVVVLGTTARGTTDDAGRFEIGDVPSGSHSISFLHARIQQLGVSPPVEPVDVRPGGAVNVALALPSEETLLDAWCAVEARGPRVARLAGVVRDTLTGVPLPRATVIVQPLGPGGAPAGNARAVKTDEAGYYRLCDAPVGPASIRPSFGLSQGLGARVELRSERPLVQDLRMVIATVGRLQGRVTDYTSGEILPGATVSLVGSDARAVADDAGRFLLDSIPPGMQAVQTGFLGYAARIDSVTVFSNEAVAVDIKLTTEPIPIEGMVVTARGRLGDELVDVGRRLDYMGRVEIDNLLPRVQNMHDLLNAAQFPALDVREINMASAAGGRITGLCIESVRMRRVGNACGMITVVVDGVPLANASEYLMSFPPESIESIRYLSPMEATTRYGSTGGAGVLELTTRR